MAHVKICGLTDESAIKAVVQAKADYAGFVYFPKSPRHIEIPRAASLRALLPASIKSVSVLVDPDDALLAHVHTLLKPDWVQLHGKESPARLAAIKEHYPSTPIIKALSIRTADDIASAGIFSRVADMLMFDAKAPASALPGGNGLSFDWNLLKGREFPLPWMLSGGLNADNVGEAIRISGATLVDVSSGVESAPGVKDPTLIKAFIKAARA